MYDGTYIGQATYQVTRLVMVNGQATPILDAPRALNLTVALECDYVDVKRRIVNLSVKAAAADHPFFGAPRVVAAPGWPTKLPLDLPQARAIRFQDGGESVIPIYFPNGTDIYLSSVVVPSFDASRIAGELGAEGTWWTHSPGGNSDVFPDGGAARSSGYPKTKYLSWSLTKTAR